MPTALEMTPAEMAEYREGARRRGRLARQALTARYLRGWALAREAKELLFNNFHATRVVVFGSLLDETRFTPWSDVDLAVWGLEIADTFHAMAAVYGMDPDIPVNLVDIQCCRSALRSAIKQEGVVL